MIFSPPGSAKTCRTIFSSRTIFAVEGARTLNVDTQSRFKGEETPRVDRLDFIDQRHEHRAVSFAYGTAKAAVVAITRTMAVEPAPDDIRVNAVAPGATATPASRTYVEEDPERDRRASRWAGAARPRKSPAPILFLLSDLSSYITGQSLFVDGGLDLKWTHLGADNTSLFLKDDAFRATWRRWNDRGQSRKRQKSLPNR